MRARACVYACFRAPSGKRCHCILSSALHTNYHAYLAPSLFCCCPPGLFRRPRVQYGLGVGIKCVGPVDLGISPCKPSGTRLGEEVGGWVGGVLCCVVRFDGGSACRIILLVPYTIAPVYHTRLLSSPHLVGLDTWLPGQHAGLHQACQPKMPPWLGPAAIFELLPLQLSCLPALPKTVWHPGWHPVPATSAIVS